MRCRERPIAIDYPVCLGCAKTAEWIEVLLGVDALGDLRNIY